MDKVDLERIYRQNAQVIFLYEAYKEAAQQGAPCTVCGGPNNGISMFATRLPNGKGRVAFIIDCGKHTPEEMDAAMVREGVIPAQP